METTNTGSGGIGAPLTDTQHRFKQEELHVSHGPHERARAPRSGRIGEDLLQGKVPNVLGEMGIKAEWRHNRAGLVGKAALAALAAGAAYYLFSSRERTR